MTRRRGFTLIELLLAMGMVVVLTASLYAAMAAAFRARVVVAAQTDTVRQAKAALDLAEQDLRSVMPPTGTFAGAFYGTPGGTGDTAAATLDFYTLGADYLVPADTATPTNTDGIRHVVLAIGYETGTPGLSRTITRDLLGTNGAAPEVETLAKNITGFEAKFYDGTNWTDTWDSTQQNNSLPVAIDLTVSVKAPTATAPDHVYHLSRMIALSCGMTPDQATALVTASEANTSPVVAGQDTAGTQTGTAAGGAQ